MRHVLDKFRPSATTKLALGLVSVLTTLLLISSSLGLFPDTREQMIRARLQYCEAVGIQFAVLAQRSDPTAMRSALEGLLERNSDLSSVRVTRRGGTTLVLVTRPNVRSTGQSQLTDGWSRVIVPILSNGNPWGQLEFQYRPAVWLSSLVPQALFHASVVALLGFVGFRLYLGRMLRQLNPSSAVPQRVRTALDTLAEGLVLLDEDERIVLVNQAFTKTTGVAPDALIGRPVSTLPLVNRDESSSPLPWTEAMTQNSPVVGRLLGLKCSGREGLTFSVSATPIRDDSGRQRGTLTSFEDVSRLEQKKAELQMMVEYLRDSSEEIKRQNRELERLATRDALTNCLNRRAFFERFATEWAASERYGYPLTAIMVDVDHFKSVNDRFGHGMGDEVLRQVGKALTDASRETDVVARYGGEEFALLLPHTDLDAAAIVAERLRVAISELHLERLSVTASLGISMKSAETADPQALLEQADRCLYFAKRNGRNQVARFDLIPQDLIVDESKLSRSTAPEPASEPASLPFQAVTALVSALAYRDATTAAHSRRVADLCVATAEGLMSLSDCYMLEIAALLHDIGKIGVPDSILLKSGPLTTDEWETMRLNEKIGVEIIRASFGSASLMSIIESHPAHFDSGGEKGLRGTELPLGARILAIANAYDSMVTDRSYRRGRPRAEAIAELRRCAGTQFDPELVERFIERTTAESGETVPARSTGKEVALAVGQQLEQFCRALDKHDFPTLIAMTKRLAATAEKYGVAAIADKSHSLASQLEGQPDAVAVLHSANELLELCRATQSSFLDRTHAPVPATSA